MSADGPGGTADIGRMLLLVGGLFVVAGLLFMFGPRLPLLGRLPGDIFYQRDGVTIIFPIATMILVSIVLTIVVNLVGRFLQR